MTRREAQRFMRRVLSRPALAGRGTIRSSQSERRMVGGARASTKILRRQRRDESDAPSTILRAARYGWSPSPTIVGIITLTEHAGRGYACQATRLDRYWSEWQTTAAARPETPMLEAQTLRTLYRVSDFVGWQREGVLELNPNFQRRSVWKKGAKSFLMDTILRGFPVPIIFLRDKKTDLKTLKAKRDVVDGQQRIRTLLSFVDPALLPDYDPKRDDFEIYRTHNRELGGKRFDQLSLANRQRILDYQFSVHSFPTDTDDRMILQIFARMNATGVKLNGQELRNAEFFGEFKTSAYELATEQLYRWRDDWEVFSPDGIARMMEVEMASEFMAYIISGVLEKKTATIDSFYKYYDAAFPDHHEVERRFRIVFDTIEDFLRNGIHLLFKSRTMFFALFAAVYGLQFEPRAPTHGRLRLSEIPHLSKDKAAPLTPEMRGKLIRNATAIKDRQAPEAVQNARRSGTTDASNRRALINYLVA
jgi:Protein of unknown function DUF262